MISLEFHLLLLKMLHVRNLPDVLQINQRLFTRVLYIKAGVWFVFVWGVCMLHSIMKWMEYTIFPVNMKFARIYQISGIFWPNFEKSHLKWLNKSFYNFFSCEGFFKSILNLWPNFALKKHTFPFDFLLCRSDQTFHTKGMPSPLNQRLDTKK